MADIRLLAACLGMAISIFGCGAVPRWSPALVGRVIDEQTGMPVPDVEVFASYGIDYFGESNELDFAWATTDGDGRFVIPGHFRQRSPRWLATWKTVPSFRLVHSEYGFFWLIFGKEDYPGNAHLEFKVEKSHGSLFYFRDAGGWSTMCPAYDIAVCERICEVAYGSAEACRRRGLPRD